MNRILWRRSYEPFAHAYVVPAFGVIGDGICEASRLFDMRVWKDEGPRCPRCLAQLVIAIGGATLGDLARATK